jgi:hypothetical protein
METEEDKSLPFVSVLVKRKQAGPLGRMVYRNPPHTHRSTCMQASIIIHHKNMLFPYLCNGPSSFVILKASTVKSNTVPRLSDKMVTVQRTFTEPSIQMGDTFTMGEAGRCGFYILHAKSGKISSCWGDLT